MTAKLYFSVSVLLTLALMLVISQRSNRIFFPQIKPQLSERANLVFGRDENLAQTSWHPELAQTCHDHRNNLKWVDRSMPPIHLLVKNNFSCCLNEVPIDGPKIEFNVTSKNPCWYDGEETRCLPYLYLVGMAKCGTTDLVSRSFIMFQSRDIISSSPLQKGVSKNFPRSGVYQNC